MSKENVVILGLSAGGSILSSFLGGWDTALKILIWLMIADYASGLLAAIKRKQVNSEVMFWGGIRKGAVLLVIGIAVMLDELVGNTSPIFRMMALYFYIAREGLSVVENLGLFGVYIPGFIKKILEQLKEKSDGVVPDPLKDVDKPLGKPVTAIESEANDKELKQ